jgi:hypothetical protein
MPFARVLLTTFDMDTKSDSKFLESATRFRMEELMLMGRMHSRAREAPLMSVRVKSWKIAVFVVPWPPARRPGFPYHVQGMNCQFSPVSFSD